MNWPALLQIGRSRPVTQQISCILPRQHRGGERNRLSFARCCEAGQSLQDLDGNLEIARADGASGYKLDFFSNYCGCCCVGKNLSFVVKYPVANGWWRR